MKDNTNTTNLDEQISSKKQSRGPHGYGDPDNRTLRKVEKEVMIPKIVRERSKILKCPEQKKAFDQCCLDNAMAHVFKCREENRRYQECLNKWFFDEHFVEECKEIYLKQRAEFRRTGIKKQMKPKIQNQDSQQQQEQNDK